MPFSNGVHELLESLSGQEPVQHLPGPVVHQVCNPVQCILIVHQQIRSLGQELPQKTYFWKITGALGFSSTDSENTSGRE